MSKRSKSPQLRDRDWEILDHISRYHMSTPEVLHRMFWQPDDGRTAVTKVTSRLVDHEYLCRWEFIGPKSYFTLGPKGTKAMGIPKNRAKRMGPQSLCLSYGALAYCCLNGVSRDRITVRELQKFNPNYLCRGVESSPYYLHEEDGITSLAFIRVDAGGSVDHVVRKCKRDFLARTHHPVFRELSEQGRFLIAVVTGQVPQDAKAVEIREALSHLDLPVRFHVESVPDLVDLW